LTALLVSALLLATGLIAALLVAGLLLTTLLIAALLITAGLLSRLPAVRLLRTGLITVLLAGLGVALPVAGAIARLLLALISLAALAVSRSGPGLLRPRQLLDFTAYALGLVQRLLSRHRLLIIAPLSGRAGFGLLQVVAELVERIGGERFAHHRILAHALAKRGFGPLHTALHFGLLAAAQSVAYLL